MVDRCCKTRSIKYDPLGSTSRSQVLQFYVEPVIVAEDILLVRVRPKYGMHRCILRLNPLSEVVRCCCHNRDVMFSMPHADTNLAIAALVSRTRHAILQSQQFWAAMPRPPAAEYTVRPTDSSHRSGGIVA